MSEKNIEIAEFVETNGHAADPFDPQSLRLSQDFGATLPVRKVLTNIPCRRPGRGEFLRVRPGEEWQLSTFTYIDDNDRDAFYLVERTLWEQLADVIAPICLRLAVNRQGVVFLWPLKLPRDGKVNSWNDSARAAAELAEESWVRVVSNGAASSYDAMVAAGELSDPVWPTESFREILRLSFQGRWIDSVTHPIVMALRGLT